MVRSLSAILISIVTVMVDALLALGGPYLAVLGGLLYYLIAGEHLFMETPASDSLVAYALPKRA